MLPLVLGFPGVVVTALGVVGVDPGFEVLTVGVNVPDTLTGGIPGVVSGVVAAVVTVTKQPNIVTLTLLILGLAVVSVMTTLSTGLSLKSVKG